MEELIVKTDKPQITTLSRETNIMIIAARGLEINNQREYEDARNQLTLVKRKWKEIDEKRKSIIKPLKESVSKITDLFKPPLETLKSCEMLIKEKMVWYQKEQEKIRLEQEAKARAVQRKEQERLREEATKAAKRGDNEISEIMEREADMLPVITPLATKPKAKGTSVRKTWSAKITDKMELIKAVAEGRAPARYLEVNIKELDKSARALKDDMMVPGVEVVVTETIAQRV